LGKEDGIPRNRIILPKAPALANTPLFTSGNPKLAFSLAITRSLLINLYYIFPFYQLTTISIPPPTITRVPKTTKGESNGRGESSRGDSTKSITIDCSNDRLLCCSLRYPTKPINHKSHTLAIRPQSLSTISTQKNNGTRNIIKSRVGCTDAGNIQFKPFF
jgi:hypothetical protein